ncbi:MAG: fused MFS/spermidine synthase [Elusimicrobiota bacterium]|nr:MAG: fused MFS/spermidine synthase [Elusimicrobiota bacterium]
MKKPPLKPEALRREWDIPYLLGSLFCSGACCLVLELAGARLISPFYGSSIYTWSAMITVTMIALAVGYAWGGRLADRYPHLTLFARMLTAAGLTIAAVPWLRVPVLKASLPLGVAAGGFASAAALLGPGLVLLGALGPIAVRLTATGAADAGRKSGDAWAVSTAGSVLGAALAGFVLIPHLPLSKILLASALVLLLLGALGSWLSTRSLPAAQLAACAACVGLLLRPAPPSRYLLEARESAYGRVAVLDAPDKRYLLVAGTSQSVMEKEGGESESQYVRAFEWTRALRPDAKRALLIGLGAGLLPKALERRGLTVDVFEIDSVIVDAAKRRFGYEPRGRVVVGDGRALLEAGMGPWDLAFLDAFGAESPPAHLFTSEAFERLRDSLAPGGVLAVNVVSAVAPPDDLPWRAVYRTLSTSFPHVRAFVASDPNAGLANILIFASESPLQAGAPKSPDRVSREVVQMLGKELKPDARELASAPVMTDDYAPFDALMAGTARRWRGLLQSGMREVLLD